MWVEVTPDSVCDGSLGHADGFSHGHAAKAVPAEAAAFGVAVGDLGEGSGLDHLAGLADAALVALTLKSRPITLIPWSMTWTLESSTPEWRVTYGTTHRSRQPPITVRR